MSSNLYTIISGLTVAQSAIVSSVQLMKGTIQRIDNTIVTSGNGNVKFLSDRGDYREPTSVDLTNYVSLVGGKIPAAYLPSYVDDVIEGYYRNSKFYTAASGGSEITGETGKIYIDITEANGSPKNDMYRYTGSTYVKVNNSSGELDLKIDAISSVVSGKQDKLTTTNKLAWDAVNHPTIPAAANNGKLTLKFNTVSLGEFTANQSSASNIELSGIVSGYQPKIDSSHKINYSNISGTLPVSANNKTMTLKYENRTLNTFTLNQTTDKTLELSGITSGHIGKYLMFEVPQVSGSELYTLHLTFYDNVGSTAAVSYNSYNGNGASMFTVANGTNFVTPTQGTNGTFGYAYAGKTVRFDLNTVRTSYPNHHKFTWQWVNNTANTSGAIGLGMTNALPYIGDSASVSAALDGLSYDMTTIEGRVTTLEGNADKYYKNTEQLPISAVPSANANDTFGLLKVYSSYGTSVSNGRIYLVKATNAELDAMANNYHIVSPVNLSAAVSAVFMGSKKATIWTDDRINAFKSTMKIYNSTITIKNGSGWSDTFTVNNASAKTIELSGTLKDYALHDKTEADIGYLSGQIAGLQAQSNPEGTIAAFASISGNIVTAANAMSNGYFVTSNGTAKTVEGKTLNKVTSISSSSTDNNIPTAKAVYAYTSGAVANSVANPVKSSNGTGTTANQLIVATGTQRDVKNYAILATNLVTAAAVMSANYFVTATTNGSKAIEGKTLTKVTSISSSSTDNNIPTAKSVYAYTSGAVNYVSNNSSKIVTSDGTGTTSGKVVVTTTTGNKILSSSITAANILTAADAMANGYFVTSTGTARTVEG